MPQISKIRIVNFTYNDGNRFIPDELYDLSANSGDALNSLFNLNNGGGKTVLAQLMMQPVNPKAMAGGRHIEDYFTRQGDHSYILIEWTTDGSRDKLLTGISIAASISNTSEETQRGNSIKYYTFKTVYEGYSPYSISSLELSKNENGRYVPATFDYVKEKAKLSKGLLEYYSSDDSVKWSKELSDYGILRSEWESVIETLNKDEGGLNQYFDEAKTSDKLIAKFFIPAIEQKMKSVAGKNADGSLETMLISYARKIADKETVIQERDTNKRLLTTLSELNELSDNLYSLNDVLVTSIAEVSGFKAALARRLATIEVEIEKLLSEIESQNSLIGHIEYEEASKAFYVASDRYEKAEMQYEKAKRRLDECQEELQRINHQEDVLQCAKLYEKIKETEGRISELKKLIEEKESDSEDAERIARLKYSVLVKASAEESELTERYDTESACIETLISEVEADEQERKKALEVRDKANQEQLRAEAELGETRKSTDALVSKLEINAVRRFDMTYQEDELEAANKRKQDIRQQLETELNRMKATLGNLDVRRGEIPNEKAELMVSASGINTKIEQIKTEITKYEALFDLLVNLSYKYSLDESAIFSGTLQTAVYEELDLSRAKINKFNQDRQTLEEKLDAAKNGHVHVLPKIMQYVKSTGISCQTGEEYICGLVSKGNMSVEKVDELFDNFPEVAYSILFYTERDLNEFLSAGNIDWLPAIVPLLTMDQISKILQNEANHTTYLAAWDREYFANRDGYCEKISNDIGECGRQIERFEQHLEECENEKKLVDQFVYDALWKKEKEQILRCLMEELSAIQEGIQKLEAEHKQVSEEYEAEKEHLSECSENIQQVAKWIENYVELSMKLAEEIEGFNKYQKLSIAKQKAENSLKEIEDKLDASKKKLEEHRKASEATWAALSKAREILAKVKDAKEAELIEGEINGLYSQYVTLCENMSEDLARMTERLSDAITEKTSAESELAGYHDCVVEEYSKIIFSSVLFGNIRAEKIVLQKQQEELQQIFNQQNGEYISGKNDVDGAQLALEEYNGIPLPRNEIGEDFRNRKATAKKEMKLLGEQRTKLDTEKQILITTANRVGDVLDETGVVEMSKAVELSDDPEKQWKVLKSTLVANRTAYTDQKGKLGNKIRDALNEYKDITIAEIVGKLRAVKSMLEDAGIKGDRLFTVSESIGTMIDSIEKINSQIETDLREIENDFNDIVNQCMKQGQRMYQDLRTIAASSKTHIFPGKSQTQMVKMNLPEENEISEEASRIAIRTEIESGANEIKALIKGEADDKDIQKRAKKVVSSQRLLLRYIKQESIRVKVFKIDMNAENSGYKRWEDTLTQSSGAEKFVVFFSVVLTLMNYTRSSAGIVSKNTKSVLILDNPFGKITSAHLLKPMFDIAKHFNVQLICLSDINKSDVINCFECVIKLVIKAQNLSNFEIMTHEGNEEIEHGYYKIMNGQMSLF